MIADSFEQSNGNEDGMLEKVPEAQAVAAVVVAPNGEAVDATQVAATGGRLLTVGDDQFRIGKIADWLRLFVDPGEVVELRALGASTIDYAKPHVESGFFDYDHIYDMAKSAYFLTHDSEGVYFTLNPINPDLLARRNNRVAPAKTDETSKDADVVGRKWLLIDADPKRIGGVSSTEEEKAAARAVIDQVRQFLRERGCPEGMLADSGNGYHLLYAIDLPAADEDLVKRVLVALADKFDTGKVTIDPKVSNPARIVKLYGTKARKGENLPARPHRWSGILDCPESREIVTKEMLEEVAGKATLAASTLAAPRSSQLLMHQQSSKIARARTYLDKVPGAISGDGGQNDTFTAANRVVGMFGLSRDEALSLMKEWNEKCEPKWTEKELLHKIDDAIKNRGSEDHVVLPGHGSLVLGTGFQADFLNSAEFNALEIRQEWLVEKVLVANQPAVMGGPKKALKTSLMIDLAISLGGGRAFLGHFMVPRRHRVLLLSGESGQATIQETARRVCRTKVIYLQQCDVVWGFQLPSLSNERDLAVLSAAIAEKKIEVVIIDPLYLCLLNGNANLQASNLYQIGPLLRGAAQACLDAGATPIFVHHSVKMNQPNRSDKFEPLELDSLAFAGIAEFTRQWVLINRRANFNPETGEHKLWLNVGGSAGHSGLYGLDVREGVLNERFGGRHWEVIVESGGKCREATAQAKKRTKELAKEEQVKEDVAKVLAVLNRHPDGETTTAVSEESCLPRGRTSAALQEALKEGKVAHTTITKPAGKNPRMLHPAWRLILPEEKQRLTDTMSESLQRGDPIEISLGQQDEEDETDTGGGEVNLDE